MTSDYVKHRLKQKAELAPRGESNWPVLELCREFAQEAFIAGVSMAFQEWINTYVSSTQKTAVRLYLISRLPGIILNQYLPAQEILDPVELADQIQEWVTKNPTWKSEVEDAAFNPSQLCDLVNRLYYSLLDFSRRPRN
jgi:hypothetical protein